MYEMGNVVMQVRTANTNTCMQTPIDLLCFSLLLRVGDYAYISAQMNTPVRSIGFSVSR